MIGVLLGLTAVLATPVAFVISLAGAIANRGRKHGIAGAIISGAAGLFFFGLPILLHWLL